MQCWSMDDGVYFLFFQVDDYKDEYLKLMSMYAILLAQSVEDPIVSDIEYAYDAAVADTNGSSSHSGRTEYDMRDSGGRGGGEREGFIIFFKRLKMSQSITWRGRSLGKRFCKMFSESSTVVLPLPCCPGKQADLSENCCQNFLPK